MTNQEIFNKVTAHLLKQGAKALADGGGCRYRATDGKMCAIGALIKEEHYHKDLESHNIFDYGVQTALRYSGISAGEDRLPFLGRLQAVHDYREPHEWGHALRGIADRFNLAFPESTKEQA